MLSSTLTPGNIEIAFKVASIIVDILCEIAKELEIYFGTDEKIDELGDKVIQAEEKGIMACDFATYKEYINCLKDFEVNPERSKEIDGQDKCLRGLGCLVSGIAEKTGDTGLMVDLLFNVAVKSENLQHFLKDYKGEIISEFLSNTKFLSDLGKFVGLEKIDLTTYNAVIDVIAGMVKRAHPELSQLEADNEALKLREF